MKSYKTFTEGYIASSDTKPGKDGKLRPARHIKTTRPDDEADMVEKLDVEKAEMGDVIKDFQDSDAPQFKGKSSEKRRQMAIAAKMQAMNSEELKGDQHKLDKNKNGKLDADDFKKLSKESADIEGLEIDEGTPDRLAMIRNIAQNVKKQKADQEKKAMRDAKRGMRSDADLGKRKDEQLVVEDAEMEKREMMKTQLHFIKYAADEIMEFVEMGGQIEEWYQNKVSKAFADFEGLHSYMEGTARKNGLKEGAGTLPFSPPYKKKTDKPNTNSDGSSTSPQSRAKQLAKRAKDNLSKTLAQHKEGVDFDSEGNILEAENKITFHQFVDATKKKKEKQDRDDRSTDINIKEISKEN